MSEIDWNELMQTYNVMHGTRYQGKVIWIGDLYKKHDYFISPLARELGVGFGTLKKYLIEWGLYLPKPSGGARFGNHNTVKTQRFLAIKTEVMKELTMEQICERCGIERSWCNTLIKRYGREYRRKKCGRPSGS